MFASNLKLSHPKLPLLANRAKNVVDLALIKAIAHHRNPQQNPLPANPQSLERAYYNLFKAIPKRKQDDAIAKFQNLMTAAQRANAYGDLGQINFASAVSIVEQATALPLPANLRFNAAEVDSLQRQIEEKTNRPGIFGKLKHPPASQQAIIAKNLDFAVISATCLKPNDIRKDETNLAVAVADSFGNPFNAGPFFVGKFKKGDTINLGAKGQLFTFNIADAVFPATFPVTAFMVESDMIKNTELVDKLLVALQFTKLAVMLVAAGFILPMVTPPVAVPIVTACGIAVAALALTSYVVLPILADDISFTISDALVLDAPPSPGDTFDRTVAIEGFGKYRRGIYNVLLRWTARE